MERPLAEGFSFAVAADKNVMDVFQPGTHGSTFGGNLACAVASAAIDVLMEENMSEGRRTRRILHGRVETEFPDQTCAGKACSSAW